MARHALVTGFIVAILSLPAAAKPRTFVLEKHSFKDPMVNNITAGGMLIPKGWRVSGGVKWYPNNWNLTCLEAKCYNPGSLEQLEFLPWMTCVWHSAPVVRMPVGTNHLGSMILRPMSPRDVVEKITIPQLRKRARVVRHYRMPHVEKTYAKKMGITIRAVRSRITFRVNGMTVEEDIYLILGYHSATFGGNRTTWWYPVAAPVAIRAKKGRLEAATPRMLASFHSFQASPKWMKQWEYVHGLFRRRLGLAIQQAGEISRIISANNDYIMGLISSSWRYRNAVHDRTSRNFSDYIRGVQRYRGGGYHYILPSGYSHAWAGSNGTVILSNNPNYNPNYGSGSVTWSNLRPVR